MNYNELHALLKREEIDCGFQKEITTNSRFMEPETTSLFIEDSPVILVHLQERINNILDYEKVKADVVIFPNEDKLTITLK